MVILAVMLVGYIVRTSPISPISPACGGVMGVVGPAIHAAGYRRDGSDRSTLAM
jgi:hypothetical protein